MRIRDWSSYVCSSVLLEFITHKRSERSGIYHADNGTNGHGEVGGSMSTMKEGQGRGGIGAADNVWPIGETKRGASVPHSLDALGVWALSWLDCDRVPRIMLSSNLMILWANAAARSALARRRDIENRSGIF